MEKQKQTQRRQQDLPALIILELATSVSQVAIFFFLALFSSNFLMDKATFLEFVNQKINKTTFSEFLFTMLAIVVVSGLMFGLLQATRNNEKISIVAKHVLLEMPRTISIFGSSVLATFLATAIHLHYFPEANSASFGKFFLIGVMFWAVSFVYAFFIKLMLNRPELVEPVISDVS
ncbi:MAG TPA: hypothetical protein VIT22_03540 [Pseudoxanthomonas sp.]